MAIMFRSCTALVCLDDKHRVKISEPGNPLAAAEGGRRVLVRTNTTFEVGDHDFSKFSIIPSVSLWFLFQASCLDHGIMGWSLYL